VLARGVLGMLVEPARGHIIGEQVIARRGVGS